MLLVVLHELAGPVMVSVCKFLETQSRETFQFAPRRCGSGPRGNVVVERRSGMKHTNISVTCAVFQLPMAWLNAEA